ncbi:hypothetical protein BCY86_02790 [Pajaroellobacter abortibovis]|uniref:Uncharacterized protein n=1 Tax=Pajaroellobacter abortibovis TaxID=1882918 RepID=A0A1L6MWB1_9BACT|nr:hypothetical protein BCY86_02790 [Pajaroellobacter abortibovis]
MNIGGVNDWFVSCLGEEAGLDLEKVVYGREETSPLILLVHQPKVIHEASKKKVDVQLFGYIHG